MPPRNIIEQPGFKDQAAKFGTVERFDEIMFGAYAMLYGAERGKPVGNTKLYALFADFAPGEPITIFYRVTAEKVLLEAVVKRSEIEGQVEEAAF